MARNVEALTSTLYIGNGADRTAIGTDGTLTLDGEATTWEDVRAPLIGSRLSSSAGKVDYDYDNVGVTFQPSGDIDTQADVVALSFQLPHNALTNTPFHFHIHWLQDSAVTREFTIDYRVIQNGVSYPSFTRAVIDTNTNNSFTYTSGDLPQITQLSQIASVPGLSTIVQLKMARTDTNTGDILGLYIDAHYMVDAFGSNDEYVK